MRYKMEKKTTQRIIGIIVAIVLIIILLPLLYHRTNNFTQAALTKEPPFPDEQTQPVIDKDKNVTEPTATNTEAENKPVPNPAPQDLTTQPEKQAENKATTQTQPTETVTESANLPDDTISEKPETSKISSDKSSEASIAQPVIAVKDIPIVHKHHKTVSVKKAQEEITELKKPAWVVQLGSFNNKNNARRLADKLRAAGYKAFMKEIKTANGTVKQTRVYIGPEFKLASAAKLSKKVEQEMKLKGFVIHFKPLEL